MPTTSIVTRIFKVTSAQYTALKNGGSVGGYSYDDNALYLVEASTLTATFTGSSVNTGTPDLTTTIYTPSSGYTYVRVDSYTNNILTLKAFSSLTETEVPTRLHTHPVTISGTVTVTN